MDVQRYVLFSGANERAVIAVCRLLRSLRIEFSIIGRPGNDPLARTAFRRYIDAVRSSDALDLEDMLACIERLRSAFPRSRLWFVPTAESINRLLLANQGQCEEAGLSFDMSSYVLYEQLSNKSSFLQLAEEYGLYPPERIVNPSAADVPCVAKPFAEFSRTTGHRCYPHLLLDTQMFQAFQRQYDDADYFFQRFVDGDSFYYLMWADGAGSFAAAFQRNLLQQDNGKSIVAAELCACPDEVFWSRLRTMLTSVGFRGFIMVEAMMENGRSYLIEANPRLWGPFELATGTAIAEVFRSRAVSAMPGSLSRPRRYLWLGGLLNTLARGGQLRRYQRSRRYSTIEQLRFLVSDVYCHGDSLGLFADELRKVARTVFEKHLERAKR